MKRIIIFTLAIMLGLGVAAFAGPFVGFDFTIPDDGTLYFGIENDPLTLELSLCDLFAVQAWPTLSFSAKHFTQFAYWDSKLQSRIDEIDFITTYPIPVVEGMGLAWRGTLHVGELFAMLAEPSLMLASSTFDIYGEVSFEYKPMGHQLIPTGSFGLYWEL